MVTENGPGKTYKYDFFLRRPSAFSLIFALLVLRIECWSFNECTIVIVESQSLTSFTSLVAHLRPAFASRLKVQMVITFRNSTLPAINTLLLWGHFLKMHAYACHRLNAFPGKLRTELLCLVVGPIQRTHCAKIDRIVNCSSRIANSFTLNTENLYQLANQSLLKREVHNANLEPAHFLFPFNPPLPRFDGAPELDEPLFFFELAGVIGDAVVSRGSASGASRAESLHYQWNLCQSSFSPVGLRNNLPSTEITARQGLLHTGKLGLLLLDLIRKFRIEVLLNLRE